MAQQSSPLSGPQYVIQVHKFAGSETFDIFDLLSRKKDYRLWIEVQGHGWTFKTSPKVNEFVWDEFICDDPKKGGHPLMFHDSGHPMRFTIRKQKVEAGHPSPESIAQVQFRFANIPHLIESCGIIDSGSVGSLIGLAVSGSIGGGAFRKKRTWNGTLRLRIVRWEEFQEGLLRPRQYQSVKNMMRTVAPGLYGKRVFRDDERGLDSAAQDAVDWLNAMEGFIELVKMDTVGSRVVVFFRRLRNPTGTIAHPPSGGGGTTAPAPAVHHPLRQRRTSAHRQRRIAEPRAATASAAAVASPALAPTPDVYPSAPIAPVSPVSAQGGRMSLLDDVQDDPDSIDSMLEYSRNAMTQPSRGGLKERVPQADVY